MPVEVLMATTEDSGAVGSAAGPLPEPCTATAAARSRPSLAPLARWRAVVLLDNCEQVLDGAAELADALLASGAYGDEYMKTRQSAAALRQSRRRRKARGGPSAGGGVRGVLRVRGARGGRGPRAARGVCAVGVDAGSDKTAACRLCAGASAVELLFLLPLLAMPLLVCCCLSLKCIESAMSLSIISVIESTIR